MSDKVVHRLYWDYEREERWLNEMSSRGWQLVRYGFGRYVFQPGKPDEWIYRIELLPGDPHSDAAREYLSLLQQSGAEIVTQYARWVYLRRAATEGPFELFTDLESRIGHYQRVLKLFKTALATLAGCIGALIVVSSESGGLAYQIPLVITAAAVGVLSVQAIRVSRRARTLSKQRQIYE